MTHRQLRPSDITGQINIKRRLLGMTERRLAEQAGIPQPSLRRKLGPRPETLTLGQLIDISDQLGVTIAELAQPSEPSEEARS